MQTPNDNFKLGLALSGGALKAAAHIGVIEALESLGLQIDCVAGTSAGAYVGTLYAHGATTKEMMALINEFPGIRLLDYGFPLWSSLITLIGRRLWPWQHDRRFQLPAGLLRGGRLERYFDNTLRCRQPRTPYSIIATDLYSGLPVVYAYPRVSLGNQLAEPIENTARVIRGSCSLPGIFSPVMIGQHLLVDGGLRSYVPVEVLRASGCTHIIAVNLYHLKESFSPETFADVLVRSFDIILDETIDADVKGDDVFSITPDVSDMSWLSFGDMHKCVETGRQAVFEQKARLEEFLATRRNMPSLRNPQSAGQPRQTSGERTGRNSQNQRKAGPKIKTGTSAAPIVTISAGHDSP